MKLDEILLTRYELEELCTRCEITEICLKNLHCYCVERTKTAQLKLLEWQSELCDEHVGANHTFRWLRRSCPECMSEIEKMLKESK